MRYCWFNIAALLKISNISCWKSVIYILLAQLFIEWQCQTIDWSWSECAYCKGGNYLYRYILYTICIYNMYYLGWLLLDWFLKSAISILMCIYKYLQMLPDQLLIFLWWNGIILNYIESYCYNYSDLSTISIKSIAFILKYYLWYVDSVLVCRIYYTEVIR